MELQKNIKLTYRNLSKNKGVTILNLIGLTVGITVSMLLFLFVLKERNTDKYIPNLENIYVLTNHNDVGFSQGMANHVKKEIAEMDAVTYCTTDWSPQIFLKRNGKSYQVGKMLTADSCFFRVFNFKALWGNPTEALNAANKIVITRSLSEKIFGNENPVGKTVTYNATYLKGKELEVTAVIDDLSQSSSWNFEAVLSFQTNYHNDWYVRTMKSWGAQNYNAFAKINANVPGEAVADKLVTIKLDAVPNEYKSDTRYGIFPFKKAYFDLPQLGLTRHGNRFTLSVIGIVGVLILLLSCVNYINMVTAQREKRYKNIGIFKTMGSSRRKIMQMTSTESALMLLIALVLSFVAALSLLPGFNLLTGSEFRIYQLFTGNNLLILFVVIGIMVLFTGIIPGFIFSKKPVTLLIRKNQSSGSKSNTRNSLLVFQFAVSMALIASILIINRQNSYVQSRDPGFVRENIVYANTNDAIYDHIDAFRSDLKQIAGINDFTFSQSVLIRNSQNWGISIINKGEKYGIHFSKLSVAPNFFDFFGIKLNEGEIFNEYSDAKKDVIINQSAKDDFKIEDLSDGRMNVGDASQGRIIGVVDDFNFESFHVPVRAAAYMCSGDCDNVLYIKVNAQNIESFRATMNSVKQLWDRISPDFPLEYHFLDQTYAAMYAKETRFQKFLLYTTLVSLVLSCLGLIGLTFFVMEQRTKEIGIRKVNGAKVSEILSLLNKDFVKWVAIAFFIATPMAWYAMNKWLENFAYKTNLSLWIFALSGVMALGIALLTVSWQSWKAAIRNPVEALRYE
jgi:putative ABC transport system permease protein